MKIIKIIATNVLQIVDSINRPVKCTKDIGNMTLLEWVNSYPRYITTTQLAPVPENSFEVIISNRGSFSQLFKGTVYELCKQGYINDVPPVIVEKISRATKKKFYQAHKDRIANLYKEQKKEQ